MVEPKAIQLRGCNYEKGAKILIPTTFVTSINENANERGFIVVVIIFIFLDENNCLVAVDKLLVEWSKFRYGSLDSKSCIEGQSQLDQILGSSDFEQTEFRPIKEHNSNVKIVYANYGLAPMEPIE